MKNTKLIYLLMAFGLIMWSCEKDLDLAPEDEITEATFFKSVNDFKLFATNFYNRLPRDSYADRQTDIAYNEGGNDVSRGTLIAPQNDGHWDGSYKAIRACNYLLEKAEIAGEEISDKLDTYKGEAYFFRAMTYYRMLKVWGGVPIVTKTLTTDSEELFAPRNSREEVFNLIVADLDKAISLLPDEVTGSNVGRITKLGAYAYKARVTLFEGTWRKNHGGDNANGFIDMAIAAADQVIASGKYELFDRRDVLGEESYRLYFNLDSDGRTNPKGLTKADQKETIIAVRFDRDLRPTSWSPMKDVRTMNPTKAMMDLFLCEDGLPIDKSPLFKGYALTTDEYVDRDPRMSTMMYIPEERYWMWQFAEWWRDWEDPNKNGFIYMGDGDDWGGRTATGYNGRKFTQEVETPLGADYPFIRLAEVYLIYAEAKFEREGSIGDADLAKSINKIRQRVGMPDLTNAFVNANGLSMQNEIRRERTVELSYEGFRYDDIRRWKIAETVLPQPIKGVKWAGTQWSTDERYASNNVTLDTDGFIIIEDNRVFDPAKHYLLPLPERQLVVNEQLKQNPGW
ncbi:RagB/SusD family nutrient uptake outer membrane protein [Puteibacter caeruleilacunae]|nr:RagB/SusD family nutrient uptake outer membrane protein [Puteibacter caeruleilacunae]